MCIKIDSIGHSHPQHWGALGPLAIAWYINVTDLAAESPPVGPAIVLCLLGISFKQLFLSLAKVSNVDKFP